MPDNTRPHTPTDTDLAAQLEAWGAQERATLAAPPEPFMRQVRAARGPRVFRRVLEGLALAAAVALVAYVALRSGPAPKPLNETVVRDQSPTPDRLAPDRLAEAATTLAGMTRHVIETGSLEWMDGAPTAPAASPATDNAAPARAADAYCAGCIEELTRL